MVLALPYHINVPAPEREDLYLNPAHLRCPQYLGILFAQYPEFACRYSWLEDRVSQIRAQQEGRPAPAHRELRIGPTSWRVEFEIVLSPPQQAPLRPSPVDQALAYRWLSGEFGPPRVARERTNHPAYSDQIADVDPDTRRVTVPQQTLQDLRIIGERVRLGALLEIEETGPGTPIVHPSEYRREQQGDTGAE